MSIEEIKEEGLESLGRFYSIYRGFIADNKDEGAYGRVKLKVPQVYGEQVMDYWAWPRGMFAGKKIGLYAVPNVGDMVWVSFEGGDPRYPVWEYGHWGEGDTPTEVKNNTEIVLLKTTAGHSVSLDDKEGRVRITAASGVVIELNKEGAISLGKPDKSDESAVLGDTAVKLLGDLIDAINAITVPTPMGPSGTPINRATFTAIKNKLNDILSTKVTLIK